MARLRNYGSMAWALLLLLAPGVSRWVAPPVPPVLAVLPGPPVPQAQQAPPRETLDPRVRGLLDSLGIGVEHAGQAREDRARKRAPQEYGFVFVLDSVDVRTGAVTGRMRWTRGASGTTRITGRVATRADGTPELSFRETGVIERGTAIAGSSYSMTASANPSPPKELRGTWFFRKITGTISITLAEIPAASAAGNERSGDPVAPTAGSERPDPLDARLAARRKGGPSAGAAAPRAWDDTVIVGPAEPAGPALVFGPHLTAAELLLDPMFQSATISLDESRRVRVPGTNLSWVLPAGLQPAPSEVTTDVVGYEGLIGDPGTYMLVSLVHQPWPGGDLAARLPYIIEEARRNSGLRQVMQQGELTISGRPAAWYEGRAVFSGSGSLAVRIVMVYVVDGPSCYVVTVLAGEEEFLALRPVASATIRSLRLEADPVTGLLQPGSRGPQVKGLQACPFCSGLGRSACGHCGFLGRLQCAACSGTGKRGGSHDQALGSCFTCFGSGTRMCGSCSGTGGLPCTGCGGSGRVR